MQRDNLTMKKSEHSHLEIAKANRANERSLSLDKASPSIQFCFLISGLLFQIY